jgi:hypothetical protein
MINSADPAVRKDAAAYFATLDTSQKNKRRHLKTVFLAHK